MAADSTGKVVDVQINSSTRKKPLYEGSTQYKSWRYSPEHLENIRTSLNVAAVAAIQNTFEADEVRTHFPSPLRPLNCLL
jgi:cyclin H